MLQARHVAATFLLSLPGIPAARCRRLPHGTGRGRHAAVRRHRRRRRRRAARCRPRTGARRHRRRVRVPRNRAIARRRPGPDAVDAGHAARPRRLRCFRPRQNVDAGFAYLRRLTDEFGTVLALAAYNAGPGAVRRYNGIPPYAQTRAYVRAVLERGRPVAGAGDSGRARHVRGRAGGGARPGRRR